MSWYPPQHPATYPSPLSLSPSVEARIISSSCFQCKVKFTGKSVPTPCSLCLHFFHKNHLKGRPLSCEDCYAGVSSPLQPGRESQQSAAQPSFTRGSAPAPAQASPPGRPQQKQKGRKSNSASNSPPATPNAIEIEYLKSERNLAKAKIAALQNDLNSINNLNSILKERIQSVESIHNKRQFDQYFPPTPQPPHHVTNLVCYEQPIIE